MADNTVDTYRSAFIVFIAYRKPGKLDTRLLNSLAKSFCHPVHWFVIVFCFTRIIIIIIIIIRFPSTFHAFIKPQSYWLIRESRRDVVAT